MHKNHEAHHVDFRSTCWQYNHVVILLHSDNNQINSFTHAKCIHWLFCRGCQDPLYGLAYFLSLHPTHTLTQSSCTLSIQTNSKVNATNNFLSLKLIHISFNITDSLHPDKIKSQIYEQSQKEKLHFLCVFRCESMIICLISQNLKYYYFLCLVGQYYIPIFVLKIKAIIIPVTQWHENCSKFLKND